MYIARTRKFDSKKQTIKNHSLQTAALSQNFSIAQLSCLAYNTALLHDIGKYCESFQKKINGETKLKVAHAFCGAIEVEKIDEKATIITKLMQFCIAGHHSGLHDFGTLGDDEDEPTLCGNLKRQSEDYNFYKEEIEIKKFDHQDVLTFIFENCKSESEAREKFAFITRYIFSCLTDSDSLNSEYFELEVARKPIKSNFKKCLEQINQSLAMFTPKTELQKARTSLQKQVFDRVTETADIYLMNMPTGSGKTLCSLKFALKKVVKFNKKRIIYVIPYNTIIDQLANIVEDMFGENISVLRHQSTFNFEELQDEGAEYKKATENWDADFIITTSVQFFESTYGNKRGKLRKLHNLADSIIIFDEAHLMPIEYLKPCLNVIAHITEYLNTEAIFLTATMPNYHYIFDGYANIKLLDLIQDKSDFKKFEKCKYESIEFEDFDDLIEHSQGFHSKLIVCNTKKTAGEVFLKCTGEKYHLSTYMTVLDREKTIKTIRRRLLENSNITVVSTSLIEAGIDLDFTTVYREMTGLDSILQAGGRCNREGILDEGNVYIFSFPKTKASTPKESITLGIIKDFPNILDGIEAYYERLFSNYDDVINSNLLQLDGLPLYQIPFRTYAENFRFISENSTSIVVPRDEKSAEIVEFMKISGVPQPRKLQKYLCNVNNRELEELNGAISEYAGMFCLTNMDYYDEDTGISLDGKDYYI